MSKECRETMESGSYHSIIGKLRYTAFLLNVFCRKGQRENQHRRLRAKNRHQRAGECVPHKIAKSERCYYRIQEVYQGKHKNSIFLPVYGRDLPTEPIRRYGKYTHCHVCKVWKIVQAETTLGLIEIYNKTEESRQIRDQFVQRLKAENRIVKFEVSDDVSDFKILGSAKQLRVRNSMLPRVPSQCNKDEDEEG